MSWRCSIFLAGVISEMDRQSKIDEISIEIKNRIELCWMCIKKFFLTIDQALALTQLLHYRDELNRCVSKYSVLRALIENKISQLLLQNMVWMSKIHFFDLLVVFFALIWRVCWPAGRAKLKQRGNSMAGRATCAHSAVTIWNFAYVLVLVGKFRLPKIWF